MNSFQALSWHVLIIFRIYVIEIKLNSVSYNRDKNLQRRRKFVGELDFPIQNSYTGQVQCLSHSRDLKFVTSLMQSPIDQHIRLMLRLYAFIIINRFVIFKELGSSKPFHNEHFDPPCIIIHYSDNCSKLHSNTSTDTL